MMSVDILPRAFGFCDVRGGYNETYDTVLVGLPLCETISLKKKKKKRSPCLDH